MLYSADYKFARFFECWYNNLKGVDEPPTQNRPQVSPVHLPLYSIEIKISTWTKDSHGLYDYEAQEDNYRTETVYVKNSCKIYRNNNTYETVPFV